MLVRPVVEDFRQVVHVDLAGKIFGLRSEPLLIFRIQMTRMPYFAQPSRQTVRHRLHATAQEVQAHGDFPDPAPLKTDSTLARAPSWLISTKVYFFTGS